MAKQRHPGYETIRLLFEGGQIKHFSQIFNHIAPSAVYKDLGLNYYRFKRLVNHPDEFTFKEIITLAGLIKVDAKMLIDMTYKQYVEGIAKKKPKS